MQCLAKNDTSVSEYYGDYVLLLKWCLATIQAAKIKQNIKFFRTTLTKQQYLSEVKSGMEKQILNLLRKKKKNNYQVKK